MTDSKALTIARYHELEDCAPLPEGLRAQMRTVVCANAVGSTVAEQTADAELMMRMLGVHPEQADDPEYTTTSNVRITVRPQR